MALSDCCPVSLTHLRLPLWWEFRLIAHLSEQVSYLLKGITMLYGLEIGQVEELCSKKVPLLPELQEYLFEGEDGTLTLHHKLIIEMDINEEYCGLINHQYEQRQRRYDKSVEERDWRNVFLLVHKPYLIDQLLEIEDDLNDEEYWHWMGVVYRRLEVHSSDTYLIAGMLRNPRPGRQHLMDEKERQFLAELPDEITIYRGYDFNQQGWAWTLNPEKAEFFARRASFFGSESFVATAVVKTNDIIAYIGSREEDEIVIDPAHLDIVEVRTFEEELNENDFRNITK